MSDVVINKIDEAIKYKESEIGNVAKYLDGDDSFFLSRDTIISFEGEGVWKEKEKRALADVERLIGEISRLIDTRTKIDNYYKAKGQDK